MADIGATFWEFMRAKGALPPSRAGVSTEKTKDAEGHEHGDDGRFTSGGGGPGKKEQGGEGGRAAWEEREAKRDGRRAHLDAADDARTGEKAREAEASAAEWDAARESFLSGEASAETLTDAAYTAFSDQERVVLAALVSLQKAGLGDADLKDFRAARKELTAAVGEKQDAYGKAAEAYESAAGKLAAAEEARPEEPDYPDEPPEPEEPDADDAEAREVYERDMADWRAEVDAWEAKTKEMEAAHEQATGKWAARYEKAEAALKDAEGALQEAHAGLEDAVADYADTLAGKLDELHIAAADRIESESSDDPEPDEDEGEEEEGDDGHSRKSLETRTRERSGRVRDEKGRHARADTVSLRGKRASEVDPMPTPRKGETQRKFLSRCMAYPDLQGKTRRQRAGECYGLWREHRGGGKTRKSQGACVLSCGKDCCSDASVSAWTYKADEVKTALVSLADTDVMTDDAEMSAVGILATTARDRQGDVIEVAGVDLSMHQWNPIVLWDHGRLYTLPIGKTVSPQGEYTVRVLPDEGIITQKTYFAKTDFARQVYALVRDRFVRANSIALKDLEVERLAPDPANGFPQRRDADGNPVPQKHILRSQLAEVTWCSLPVNPEAVCSLLAKGRINAGGANDVPLDPLILKSFEPFVPPRRAWANGLTVKSAAAPTEPGREGHNVADNEKTRKSAPDRGQVDGGGEAVRGQDSKPGAVALRDLHDGLTGLKDMVSQHLRRTEDPAVVEHLQGHADTLESMCSETRDLHNDKYADEEPLEGEKSEDDEEDKGGTGGSHEPGGQETEEEVEQKSRRKSAPRAARATPPTTRKSIDPAAAALSRTLARERARLVAETEELALLTGQGGN